MSKHLSKASTKFQHGFTFLELLIAMGIVLMVIVAVQQFVSQVSVDGHALSIQQDENSQTEIVLSNLQNDLARAGFTPFASESGITQIAQAVKLSNCDGADCKGEELTIEYWNKSSEARDCLGQDYNDKNDKETVVQQSGWTLVRNIYQFRKDGDQLILYCKGNGGQYFQPLLNNIYDFKWTLSSAQTNQKQSIQLCLNTQSNQRNQALGDAKPRICGNKSFPENSDKVYHTLHLEMSVQAPTAKAVP